VEFFLRVVFNEKCQNLQEIRRRKIFQPKSSENSEGSDKSGSKKEAEKKVVAREPLGCDVLAKLMQPVSQNQFEINDIILRNFATRETLLMPFIRMNYPVTRLDADAVNRLIDDGAEVPAFPAELRKPAPCSPSMPTLFDRSLPRLDPAFPLPNRALPPLLPSNRDLDSAKPVEIIEISDDEVEPEERGERKQDPPSRSSDVDSMIDLLIHQCPVPPDLHPSLLRDHQMQVELNGFLLFVNFSIRFSLRFPLDPRDRHVFTCIFISSVIVGLTCLVYTNENGINIERLTTEGYRIVTARLDSVQLSVRQLTRTSSNSYSVLLNPDISRLVHMTLRYVRGYHEKGQLVDKNGTPVTW